MTDFKKKIAEKKLQEQLDQVKRKAAPNLNPSYSRAKKKEPAPPPAQIEEYGLSEEDTTTIKRLTERHSSIIATQSLLKKEKEIITSQLKPLCKDNAIEKFSVGGITGSYYKQTRKTISRESLLAHGVDPQIITACTEETVAWAFKTSKGEGDGSESE